MIHPVAENEVKLSWIPEDVNKHLGYKMVLNK